MIEVGDKVRFHPIIGLKHDGHIYTVRCIGTLYGEPVAWLYGKPACVTVAALSRCESITCPRVAQAGLKSEHQAILRPHVERAIGDKS